MKKTIEKNEMKSSKKAGGVEINIVPLLLHLLKHLWIILLVGVIAGAMGFAGTKLLIKPTYRCGFTAYVNNKTASTQTDFLNSSDVSAAQQLVLTYSKVIRSNSVLASADEVMNFAYGEKKLKPMVGTQIEDETEIIQVYVIADSPEEAYKIANAVAQVSPQVMADIIEGSSMKIVELPQLPDHIYQPSYLKYTIMFFGIGALLAMIVLIIIYVKNDTVTDEEELESRFPVPVLGVIPDVNSTSSGKSGYYYNYYYYGSGDKDKDKDKDKEKDKEKEKDKDKDKENKKGKNVAADTEISKDTAEEGKEDEKA